MSDHELVKRAAFAVLAGVCAFGAVFCVVQLAATLMTLDLWAVYYALAVAGWSNWCRWAWRRAATTTPTPRSAGRGRHGSDDLGLRP